MHLRTKLTRLLLSVTTLLTLLFLVIWFSLIHLAYDSEFASIFHPILYAPREILFLTIGILSVSSIITNKKIGIVYVLVFNSILISQLDYNFSGTDHFLKSTPNSIKIVSINTGGSAGKFDNNRFIRWLDNIDNLSLIAFQEARQEIIKQLRKKSWNVLCIERLCLASHKNITINKSITRRSLGGWGVFIAHFQIKMNEKTLNIFNVHLDTLRKGLEPLINRNFSSGFKQLSKNYSNRIQESQISSELAHSYNNVIVVGDFNMVNISPIYQKFWSHYTNAFSEKGNGFAYSKHTRWHGIRIDHILTSNTFSILDYQTGPFLSGDHRPILAEMTL